MDPGMQGKRPPRSGTVLVLLVVGSAILISTLFQGWYITGLGPGPTAGTFGETFYPTTVQVWGSPQGHSYSDFVSYFELNLNHTGLLYVSVTALIVVAGVIGPIAAYVLRRDADGTRRRFVSALVIMAVIVAAAGPVLVTVAQPSATCADWVPVGTPLVVPSNSSGTLPCGWDIYSPNGHGGYQAFSGSTSGPQSSFFGSENGTGEPHFWEPSVGWYLAWLATVFLLIGALLYLRGVGKAAKHPGPRSQPERSDSPAR
jgi:hypothetical protein